MKAQMVWGIGFRARAAITKPKMTIRVMSTAMKALRSLLSSLNSQ